MIVEFLCGIVVTLIQGIFSVVSVVAYVPTSITDTLTLVIKAMQFFPIDVWLLCLGSFIFWGGLHFTAALFKFIFNKIPLLNIRW